MSNDVQKQFATGEEDATRLLPTRRPLIERLEPICAPQLLVSGALMQAAIERCQRLAQTDHAVLLIGEQGTGKRTLGHHLHACSRRAEEPLIILDGSIPVDDSTLLELLFGRAGMRPRAGLLEQASDSTLLLTRVEGLPIMVQERLLECLRTGRYGRVGEQAQRESQARLVATTRVDLNRRIRQGLFVPELYYHLRTSRVSLPRVQEQEQATRRVLIERFIERAALEEARKAPQIEAEALAALLDYPWPGNLTELIRYARAMVLIADGEITLADLPREVRTHPNTFLQQQAQRDTPEDNPFADEPTLQDLEARYIAHLLHLHDNNRSACARVLKIGRNTLLSKIRQYNLE